ncbi:MAG TPA: acyl-CoA-binding protein [Polyangiaceae bacterium LLY-WYZ-15_(1-7)]|nr:acyl-CoA-binding protein [Myxococcales bacterium]MAT28687.1 acyl-CoA-binding protein [Sandaracinus sp.]HJK95246.1 acyl-CoA-binding protein [Polyangiaceae bacterium LLY-WYZ-15_(1-7)]HJL02231.1 acyl-CoA-binding protein [Polyangiaceae bacterium LLY-WYZ-15_(1-7)]HJL13311.1 acyl-CoA-binding protein [Polyangiaceae bacterium LLY-WYZ-15_(1-7)]
MASVEEFEAAIARVNGLPKTPPNDVLLKLYGLYKQATAGDVSGKRPGMLDVRGRAKYDAWAGRAGMSREDARAAYVKLADSLA